VAIEMSFAAGSPTQAVPGTQSEGPFWYSMYGLSVLSDIRLPIAPLPVAPAETPDVVFVRAHPNEPTPEPEGQLIATEPCRLHGIELTAHRGPSGCVIWARDIGTCHILPGAQRVVVYPDHAADPGERAIALMLAGQVSVFVLHQRGRPTLHASAVVTPHGGLVFFGPSGQGKSTMAACFIRRGAALLTDDVLPLQVHDDGVYARPSLPYMKVWPKTAGGALNLADNLPGLTEYHDKRLLTLDGRFHFAETPARLRACYILSRYSPEETGNADVTIRGLSAREGVAALLAQVSRGACLLPHEAARFLPVYAQLAAQAPVRLLRYPNGFEHHDAVYACVLADAAEGIGQ
jgi:hypothetical protein